MAEKIGLDTNVALRWLFNDSGDPVQSALAAAAVQALTGSIQINEVVLAELVWLAVGTRKLDRAEVALMIRSLLDNPSVELAQRAAVSDALTAFERGGAGFADHLIAALNRAAGCSTTLTFDKTAANSPDFTLLA